MDTSSSAAEFNTIGEVVAGDCGIDMWEAWQEQGVRKRVADIAAGDCVCQAGVVVRSWGKLVSNNAFQATYLCSDSSH